MDLCPYLFCLSFYLLYFFLPSFKDNGLLLWVPDVLCQHSEIVLWNLLSVQMFFWSICGGESGLPVLFLHHLLQIFLNEIWNHIYFIDDNWNKDISAILTYGILYISYTKMLIKIFWHKYVIFYISLYRNQETDFPTWIRTSLHFTYRNLWTDFHTCHMRFFTFNIRNLGPDICSKIWKSLCFICENSANIPIWNMEFSTYHIWNRAIHFLHKYGISMYQIWTSLLKFS